VTLLELALCPHPSQRTHLPAPRVTLSARASGLHLVFALPDVRNLALPAPGLRGATDGLWQHTCFECFVGAAGERAYSEFNASPSLPEGQWAHYRFSDERQRAPETSATALHPHSQIEDHGLRLSLDLPWSVLPNPQQPWDLGLSTVTESQDGQITHWALRHDRAQADFHHRASWLRIAPPWPSPTGQP
jgi:hypothetical protein